MYYNFIILRLIYYSAKMSKAAYIQQCCGEVSLGDRLSNGSPLCYWTIVCTVCLSVCNVGIIMAKLLDGPRCHLVYGGIGLAPGHIVLDGDRPSSRSSPQKGHSTPTFRPMSVVVKRSPISVTAKPLFFT